MLEANGRSISLAEHGPDAENRRCTAVAGVQTVEHVLAALVGLGVTNAVLAIEGQEFPVLDGSAVEFTRRFHEWGFREQDAEAPHFKLREPVFCHSGTAALCALPADTFSVAYLLDYGHPKLKAQLVDFQVTAEIFEKEIAPARTFCTSEEAQTLKAAGFGKGADLTNTLVIGADGPVGGTLRFQDECARHKVLDLIGDLGMLGFSLSARIVALRSGHALNRELAECIRKQRRSYGGS